MRKNILLRKILVIYKCAAIIIDNDFVLMVRKKGAKGYFSPGGKLQLGESHEQCLRRELLEELDVDLISFQYFNTYQDISLHDSHTEIILYCYICKISSQPTPSAEISDISWQNIYSIANTGCSTFHNKVIPDFISSRYENN